MEKIIYTLFSIFALFILFEISCYLFTYKYNIIFVSSAWWLFNLNLVIWNPYEFYPVSFERLILYHSPLILFPLGYIIGITILGKTKLKSKSPSLVLPVKIESLLNQRFIIYVLVANFLFSLLLFSLSMRSAYSLGLSTQGLRDTVFSSDVEQVGGIFRFLIPISWFSGSLSLYATFYYLYYYFFSIERNLGFKLALSISPFIFNGLSAGGRNDILDIVFIFVSTVIVVSTISRVNPDLRSILKAKNIYKKFTYSLLILSLIIIIMSQLREGLKDLSFLSFLYTSIGDYVTYFTAPFFAFDQLLDTERIERFYPDRFGYSLLGFDTVIVSGFLRFLNIGSLLGLGEVNSILSQISYNSQQGVFISQDLVTNAFYTLFMSAYIDGGYIYAYFLPFCLGFIYSIVNYKALSNFNFLNFSLIIFSYLYLFNSVRYSLFQSPTIAIFLILIFFSGQVRARRKA